MSHALFGHCKCTARQSCKKVFFVSIEIWELYWAENRENYKKEHIITKLQVFHVIYLVVTYYLLGLHHSKKILSSYFKSAGLKIKCFFFLKNPNLPENRKQFSSVELVDLTFYNSAARCTPVQAKLWFQT